MRLVVTLILLSSCGLYCEINPVEDTYIKDSGETVQGFEVRAQGNPTSLRQVEKAIDLVADLVVAAEPEQFHLDKIHSAFGYRDLVILVEDEPFECSSSDSGTCLGEYNGINEIRYAHFSCLGTTSLAHELIHLYGAINGVNDHDHQDPVLFDDHGGKSSVEFKAKKKLSNLFCECS